MILLCKRFFYALLIVFFFFATAGLEIKKANAQSNDSDFGIRAGTVFYTNITPTVSIALENNLRLNQNASQFDKLVNQVSVSYKLYKSLKIQALYRYNLENAENANTQRFALGASYKLDLPKKLFLSNRVRYQLDTEPNKSSTRTLRHQIALQYSRKKIPFEPFVSFEYFYRFYYQGNFFSRTRYMLGTNYRINKNNDIEIAGMLQNSRSQPTAQNKHLYTINLSFSHKF